MGYPPAFFQNGHEQLFETMEKRMMDVEQQLRLVKRLLQEKVNQLKEQVSLSEEFRLFVFS